MDLLATANPTRKFKAINDRNKEFREGDSATVAYAAQSSGPISGT